MNQIYELDKAMGMLEAVNQELFKGYKAARALLDACGGKAKKGPQPGWGSTRGIVKKSPRLMHASRELFLVGSGSRFEFVKLISSARFVNIES
ncbi:hypothetical protein MON38_08500 [Hymenobacter sp. DH14]|uniref:Uncharacterized protein n=1 Tax=Hymenobacter cyanobacteriorum TaxID=2926463 RepID=A0A9X1VE19_9BACT|nr:hypothetical protein [Hymenobacter cyanobacteriorum]MCI1187459.1 hypothetical protein [Hymenobacter cyanobacteriorum]